MFFPDHEKAVYRPPGGARDFDPLALDRALVRATDGRLNALLTDWRAGADGLGDVGPGAAEANALASAAAEEVLAAAARAVFELPAFPACTDAVALEALCHYLEYMEGKGPRGATPPPPPDTSACPPP